MLSHIWSAIDRYVAHDPTVSAPAHRAGLDPTTFNRSKHFAAEGRPRWPSTGRIARILPAPQTDIERFIALDRQEGPRRPCRSLTSDDVEWMARIVWACQ